MEDKKDYTDEISLIKKKQKDLTLLLERLLGEDEVEIVLTGKF
jgi:hypothetical protein